jgi:hypothetical protein
VRSSSKKLQRLGQNSVKSRAAITGRE